MKIIKIEKNNSDLIVTLDATYTIGKIYIDALSNLDNISSTNDIDHTKSFAGYSNSIFTINILIQKIQHMLLLLKVNQLMRIIFMSIKLKYMKRKQIYYTLTVLYVQINNDYII